MSLNDIELEDDQDYLIQGDIDVHLEYLTFMIDKDEFGVEILKILEIKSWSKATPLPCAAKYVEGVLNLRGNIIPIIDLRNLFGIKKKIHDDLTVIIVLQTEIENEKKLVGMTVDSVSDVHHLNKDAIVLTPDIGKDRLSDFLIGIANISGRMVKVLNVNLLVDFKIHDEILCENS